MYHGMALACMMMQGSPTAVQYSSTLFYRALHTLRWLTAERVADCAACSSLGWHTACTAWPCDRSLLMTRPPACMHAYIPPGHAGVRLAKLMTSTRMMHVQSQSPIYRRALIFSVHLFFSARLKMQTMFQGYCIVVQSKRVQALNCSRAIRTARK
jgi:hypothetical protein